MIYTNLVDCFRKSRKCFGTVSGWRATELTKELMDKWLTLGSANKSTGIKKSTGNRLRRQFSLLFSLCSFLLTVSDWWDNPIWGVNFRNKWLLYREWVWLRIYPILYQDWLFTIAPEDWIERLVVHTEQRPIKTLSNSVLPLISQAINQGVAS